jgi:hypothetical protein
VNIYLVNESKVLNDEEVQATLAPLTVYSRHIRSWWGSMQPGIFFGAPAAAEAWQILIVDDADQANALGYHEIGDNLRPLAFVFAKVAQDYGYDWQVTLAHEFAEMLMDPFIARCEQTGDSRFHALELCDPVEDESLGYVIRSGGHIMNVSDFVTPYWFIPGVEGKYDHMGYCTKPLEVLDGGYSYFYEDGQWQSEDHLGEKLSVAAFKKKHPDKTRLERYARPRTPPLL